MPQNPRSEDGAPRQAEEGERIRDLLNRLEAARARRDEADAPRERDRRRGIGLGVGAILGSALGGGAGAAPFVGAGQGLQQAQGDRRERAEGTYQRELEALTRQTQGLQMERQAGREAEQDRIRRMLAESQAARQAAEMETLAERLEIQGRNAEAATLRARAAQTRADAYGQMVDARYGAGRRTGGGGGAALPRPEGVDEATWSALPLRERRRLAREAASADARRAREGDDGGTLIYDSGGVEVRSNLAELDSTTTRGARNAIGGASGALTALARMERVASQAGLAALVPGTPEHDRVVGELEAARSQLLAGVAQVRNTGVINPSEMPSIEASLPDPTSIRQWATGSFANRLRSWRGQFEGQLRTALVSASVPEEQIGAVTRQLLRAAELQAGGRSAPSGGTSRESGGATSSGGRRRYRVTLGARTVERELTPAQARAAEARGAGVEAL